MFLPTTLRVAVAAAVGGAALAIGAVTLTAGAAGTNTTYYACLNGGKLSSVGTKAPTCTSPATLISWNQTGPAGATILSGTGAPGIGVGLGGDYYIETSNHTIFGPAVRSCSTLPCKTFWGAGTSLVGPPGQGYSYDTDIGSIVNDPSGQSVTVLTQTLPVGGDYQVSAYATGHNTGGDASDWHCALDAANPGHPSVQLNANVVDGVSGSAFVNTTVPLLGVVSIAAGGTISIVCYEGEALKSDQYSEAHITSTQVSGLSIVPPG
jgi:hypothetical protein